jgi:hypothetical protein
VLFRSKTGIDIEAGLRAALKTITAEQTIEIKEYSKKLNSVMMFYMVIACVLPSLGFTMFLIFASFINIQMTTPFLAAIFFGFGMLQMSFIVLIRAMRPMVNL